MNARKIRLVAGLVKRQPADGRGYSRLLATVLLAYAGHASALSTTKTFTPDNIATNATSNLKIALTHLVPLNNLTITDNFPTTPGAMVLANATTTNSCNGTLTDTSGGSLAAGDTGIRLNNGSLTALLNPVCNFTANVTANTAGAYTNTTGTPSGTTLALLPTTGTGASASLYVYDPPTITKTITPGQVNLNGTATLTYTITNPATNPGSFTDLAFTETYQTPGPVRVNRTNAVPGYTSSGCGTATISVNASGNFTKYSGGILAPGETCTITVILTGVAYGLHSNSVTLTATKTTTGSKNIAFGTITSNVASLLVTPLSVDKSFPATNGAGTDNNVQTNANTNLAIKLTTVTAISGLSITDTFPTTPGAMTVANTPVGNTCGGSVTDDSGGTLSVGDTGIRLSSGTLAANANCTVTTSVRANTRGTYVNTTGPLSGAAGASAAADSDSLNVYDPPVFSKSFSPDTIESGGTSVLTFTITNPSGNPGTISNFSFTDVLPTTPGPMKVAATPGLVTCGTGTLTAAANASSISYSGGSLAPGASCTLQVNVTASAAGTYANSVTLANTGSGNLANVNTGGGKVSFSVVTATSNLTVMQTSPILSVAKTVSVLDDPINGSSNPKAIPGATMVYAITVSNTGPGSTSVDSTVITDPVPGNLTLCTGNTSGSSGLTVAFIDGSGGNASGLTALTAGDISYSSTAGGGAPFTYAPAANTCDPAITGLRINPKGSMSGASGGNTPTFTLQFKTTVR